MKLHLGDLFWEETRTDADYLELNEDISTDILVIGGGMSGAAVSHKLTEAGFDVVVVDKGVPGYGSSDGNTGIIQYNSDKSLYEMINDFGEKHAVDFYKLSILGMEELENVAKLLPDEVGYKSTESLFLASEKKSLKELEKNFTTLRKYGFPAEYIFQDTLADEYDLNAFGAIKTSMDAELNPFKMVQALHRDNLKKDTKVFKNTEVLNVEELKDEFIAHTSTGLKITSKKLVIATGYAEKMYPKIEKGMERNTTFSFVTEVLDDEPWGNGEMIWDNEDPYVYFRLTEDGRIIAGGRDRSGKELSDEKKIQRETDKIYKKMKSYYPKLKAKIEYRWQSVFGESKDGLPFIGQDKKNKNKYYVLGYGGNGTCYSFIASILILHYIMEKEHEYAYTTRYPRENK